MALKVLLLKGLPASGKSTFAKELLEKEPGKWKRTSKDDLRAMLDNGKWTERNEKFVLRLRDYAITAALTNGFNVVVDDTNLSPKHEEHIRGLANWGDGLGKEPAELEIKFFDVPVSECVRRDAERPNGVGAKVIYKMYNQFLKPQSVNTKTRKSTYREAILDIVFEPLPPNATSWTKAVQWYWLREKGFVYDIPIFQIKMKMGQVIKFRQKITK